MVAVRGEWVVRIDPAIFIDLLPLFDLAGKRSSFFRHSTRQSNESPKMLKDVLRRGLEGTRLRTKPLWQGCKLWTIKLRTYDTPLRAATTLHTGPYRGPYLFTVLKRHCASFVFDVPKLQCAWSSRPVSKTSRWIPCSPGSAIFENLSKEPSDDPLMALRLAQCSLAERMLHFSKGRGELTAE